MARTEKEINHWQREMDINTRSVVELAGRIGEGRGAAQSLRSEERAFNERKLMIGPAAGKRAGANRSRHPLKAPTQRLARGQDIA